MVGVGESILKTLSPPLLSSALAAPSTSPTQIQAHTYKHAHYNLEIILTTAVLNAHPYRRHGVCSNTSQQANGDPSDVPNDDEEASAVVDERADTWGFSWMPAIEEFVGQAAAAADHRDPNNSEDSHGGDPGDYDDYTDDEEVATSRVSITGRSSSHDRMNSANLLPGSSSGRNGRKRRRPQAISGTAVAMASRRRAPRPPSYNETLLADKSFHNPHASETMADAFGILRPASFVLDVGADDRPWGGVAEAATAAAAAAAAEGGKRSSASAGAGVSGGDEDRNNWFYDTVRDRQNRLWADTRVRKGVELARKGQHQVGDERDAHNLFIVFLAVGHLFHFTRLGSFPVLHWLRWFEKNFCYVLFFLA